MCYVRASTFISRLPTAVEVAFSGSHIVRSERKSERASDRTNEQGGWLQRLSTPSLFSSLARFFSCPRLFERLKKAAVGENELANVPELV